MANRELPSAASLKDVRAPAATPSVSAPSITYDELAAGGKALAGGVSSLGKGVSALASSFENEQDKADQHDAAKRMVDFRLQVEQDWTEHEKNMTPGAPGYAESWERAYQTRAKTFFGKGGENIPQSQRQKVDYELVRLNQGFSERALRAEQKERERQDLQWFTTAAEGMKDSVRLDPDRYETNLGEMRGVLATSRLSPVQREAVQSQVEERLTKARIEGLTEKGRIDEAAAVARDYDAARWTAMQRARQGAERSPEGWTATNVTWRNLDPYQRAAVMAMMEADGRNPQDAVNVLGAIVNRARKEGDNLGAHVSRRIYQPVIEPSQEARLNAILDDPRLPDLVAQARRYWAGEDRIPHQATHFLAHEPTMLALEAQEPQKYRSWRQWTGFDPATGQYTGVMLRDRSHAFLSPDGMPPDGPPPPLGSPPPPSGGEMSLLARTLAEKRNDATQSALALERFQAKTLLKSDLESTLATGEDVPGLDLAKIETTIGRIDFAKYQAEKKAARDVWASTHDLYALSDAAIGQRLDALTPKPGDPNFAQQQAVFQAVQDRLDAVRKQRHDDPAGSVDRDPHVLAALAEARGGGGDGKTVAVQKLVEARIAAQERAGIAPEARSPITVKEAKDWLGTLQTAAVMDEHDPPKRGQDGRLVAQQKQMVEAMRTAYGPHANAAMLAVLRQATGRDRALADAAGDVLGSLLSGRPPGAPAFRRLDQAREAAAATQALPVAQALPTPHSDLYGVEANPPPGAPKRFPMPPYQAQQMLFDRPETAAQFDEIFGPGAAERTLSLRTADQARNP